jgi:hypothetical protein
MCANFSMDGSALGTDRRRHGPISISISKFESREARYVGDGKALMTSLWLITTVALGDGRGLVWTTPRLLVLTGTGQALIDAVGKYFPLEQQSPDTLDWPNTQAS